MKLTEDKFKSSVAFKEVANALKSIRPLLFDKDDESSSIFGKLWNLTPLEALSQITAFCNYAANQADKERSNREYQLKTHLMDGNLVDKISEWQRAAVHLDDLERFIKEDKVSPSLEKATLQVIQECRDVINIYPHLRVLLDKIEKEFKSSGTVSQQVLNEVVESYQREKAAK